MKYFAAHPIYNSMVYVAIGAGIGILITYPYINHPVRIGAILVALGIAGHLYPLFAKK